MNSAIRSNHRRLQCVFEMIEKTDAAIKTLTAQMERFDNAFWRNTHAKEANKYRRIRARLYAYYADIFQRMASSTVERLQAAPQNIVQVAENFY